MSKHHYFPKPPADAVLVLPESETYITKTGEVFTLNWFSNASLPACRFTLATIHAMRSGYGERTYPSVFIRGRFHKVSHLLLAAFVRPRLGREVARHLNDDSTDNRLENLAWGSYKDNAADAKRNGRTARGERGGRAKLTEAAVRAIHAEYASSDKSAAEVGRGHGVAKPTVDSIVRGRTWKHLGLPEIRRIERVKLYGGQTQC